MGGQLLAADLDELALGAGVHERTAMVIWPAADVGPDVPTSPE
ncbi:hypothetical protein ACFQ8C_10180 [Streptomyces sp. NPDC056503]